jgi:alpha-glucosidase (family GH31 glycosyl hydrolase)
MTLFTRPEEDSMKHYLSSGAISLSVFLIFPSAARSEVFRTKFNADTAYLVVEILDDDLVHVEASAIGEGPSMGQTLYTSPMVLKTDYPGPSAITQTGNTLETSDLRLVVNPATLCLTVDDKTQQNTTLTTICPINLEQDHKGLEIAPGLMEHVYGLGQEFKHLGSANGDWIRLGTRQGLAFGNGFQDFQKAKVGNVQIPVYYAVGPNNLNYALFLDNVYQQTWDFTSTPWTARMFGDQLRFYIMTGPDLPDLRADYLELTGRPPVPPRKSFGLWVSEFGYDNWAQIDTLLSGLRDNHFPVDGFVLDLNWFGGVDLNNPERSNMGRLDWDENQDLLTQNNPYFFPDPASRIQAYANDHIRLTAIEESYLANTIDTFTLMPADLTVYERTNGICDDDNQTNPVIDVGHVENGDNAFWGIGRMIDWSDSEAGEWVHRNRRFPNLVQLGIHSHWTDLGEPETLDKKACYEGVEITSTGLKNEHADLHNLYNLLWNRSIWESYVANQGQTDALEITNPRPFIVTRSGAAGTQRYGAAMWSGDIASNLESLATHFNAQMHMSFSGIDYYGADIGGFRREVLPGNNKEGVYRGYETEMYTQWFANGTWLDVPVRPHTDNEFVTVMPPYETAPHRVGHVESNLANLRQRYELIPYYYALAYRAHLWGEPVIPPPVFYYQNDPNLREMGHEKMIGRDILVGVVASHGEYERDLYLPAGNWINYHTNEGITSAGEWVENVPVYRDGMLRLPAFVRAGAILPLMSVDNQTKDAFGHRSNGPTPRNELLLRVYTDPSPSSFTLYEDDGLTLNYNNGRPVYHHRTTEIQQQQVGSTASVTIAPAVDVNGNGPFPGAVNRRPIVVELIATDAAATDVSLNGTLLTEHRSEAAFEAASSGWYNTGNHRIVAKSTEMDVYNTEKTFTFDLEPIAPMTSVNFVCDRGFTEPGQSIYVVGSLPALGNWNPTQAIRLNPSIYYEYIYNPPAGHHEPGAPAPVWTGVIDNLPPNTTFEWKCIRRPEDGFDPVEWQPGENVSHTTTASGYAGRSYGSF